MNVTFSGTLAFPISERGSLLSGITFNTTVDRTCLPDHSLNGFSIVGGSNLTGPFLSVRAPYTSLQ